VLAVFSGSRRPFTVERSLTGQGSIVLLRCVVVDGHTSVRSYSGSVLMCATCRGVVLISSSGCVRGFSQSKKLED
jgi:hypothetical protein